MLPSQCCEFHDKVLGAAGYNSVIPKRSVPLLPPLELELELDEELELLLEELELDDELLLEELELLLF